MTDLASIRKQYQMKTLDEKSVAEDPISQFESWLNEAVSAGAEEPTAMTLATADPDGKPSARMVLLKNLNERGFTFYTNYQSHKGRQIERNPAAALVFFWPVLERQVRVEGIIEKVSEKESEEYFLSRPAGSQLSAWSSPQSTRIPDRKYLEDMVKKTAEQFTEGIKHKPPFWGGYILVPDMIEFWQGRPDRLHDRICYVKENNIWRIERLAP
ncbi:MAG: pyridoxamine 5'-phosphate oxidase [Syntrophothermus sp.]